jgi:hypothetical protein
MTVMKLLLLFATLFLAMGAVSAQAEPQDLLVVVLEKDGQTSGHYQPSPNCSEFLGKFHELMKNGKTVTLTFFNPKATGRVVKAYCVRPDGSYRAPNERECEELRAMMMQAKNKSISCEPEMR